MHVVVESGPKTLSPFDSATDELEIRFPGLPGHHVKADFRCQLCGPCNDVVPELAHHPQLEDVLRVQVKKDFLHELSWEARASRWFVRLRGIWIRHTGVGSLRGGDGCENLLDDGWRRHGEQQRASSRKDLKFESGSEGR